MTLGVPIEAIVVQNARGLHDTIAEDNRRDRTMTTVKTAGRKPEWLKIKIQGGRPFQEVEELLRRARGPPGAGSPRRARE